MRARVKLRVTVRYFAAACAAAGTETEVVELPAGATVAGLLAELKSRDIGLANVLARCSFLCDGVAVRDRELALNDSQTIDVLPPFAGG